MDKKQAPKDRIRPFRAGRVHSLIRAYHPRVCLWCIDDEKVLGFSKSLAKHLKANGLEPTDWDDARAEKGGKLLAQKLTDQLAKNDFFVPILVGPSAGRDSAQGRTGPRRQARGGKEMARETPLANVWFEAGAAFAFGSHGERRVFPIVFPRVRPPEYLGGINSKISVSQSPDKCDVKKIAERLAKYIAGELERRQQGSADEEEAAQDDGRIHFLSLIRCAPAFHRLAHNWILRQRSHAFEQWGIRYEGAGMLWGRADNFLLFSAPSIMAFTRFSKHMRTSADKDLKYEHGTDPRHPLIASMDSRLIFPGFHWNNPKYRMDGPSARERGSAELGEHGRKRHLVLVPVRADRVEDAYKALLPEAQNPSRGDRQPDARIIYLGVAAGDDDLFFVTDARSSEDHRAYIAKLGKTLVKDGWMTHNTSSIRITYRSGDSVTYLASHELAGRRASLT